MPSLSLFELLVIALVALVVIGPERIPFVTRKVGRMYGQFRRAADDFRKAMVLEADRLDEEERLKDLRRKTQEELDQEHQTVQDSVGEGATRQPSVVEEAARARLAETGADEAQSLPPGFSQEEWDELPPHVKALVMKRESNS